MRRSSALLLALVILSLSLVLPGCFDDNKELSRYPRIAIPGYTSQRYYVFLYDNNRELVYNAVCNMIEDASSMGSALSDKKADKSSSRFILASNTYKRVVELLKSNDDRIVSACLRFLQLLAPQYDKKEELIAPVLKIGSRARNSRYEQLVTLAAISCKNSPVSDGFLKKALADRSWLVSRATYGLINKLENDKIRSMLIARYSRTPTEYEKLLILTSMNDGQSADVLAFLTKEALDTKDKKIKNYILRCLKNARDTSVVLKWVDDNYGRISPDDIKEMRDSSTIDDDFTSALYVVSIKKGWVPDDLFLADVYDRVLIASGAAKDEKLSDDDIKRRINVQNLKKEILANKPAADKWRKLEAAREALAKNIYNEIKPEYDAMTKQFKERMSSVLDKYNVDPDKKAEFLDTMSSAFMNDEAFDNAANIFKLLPPGKEKKE